ncbi:hypothetical protein HXX76_011706 [Chlamydomonas incerta]|uniref:GATA-type domain-containing protein n=1 Tax=Chlamydomonas incerta TaxID=51695 RepID=A0A835VVB2_CHLIN|nr:hypothetical protein HXX76_011706 [Chlamydomonas incerta]|eukprot:KAG2426476.1 hypothetical protein HXX76_011706 [Chlamydomonas incerta]
MRGSTGGPCCHCGTVATPCWRKGPCDKPVLCNACGSRYLVKGSLAGYFPGARRASAGTRSEAPQIQATVVSAAGKSASRKPAALSPVPASAGAKRKAQELDGNENGAKRIFNNYEALEELRAFFQASRPQAPAQTSDSHDSQGHFRDEAQYLDASSDDGLEHPDSEPVAALRHMRAPLNATTNYSAPRVPLFQRRPRKQLHPVPCSC